MKNFWKTKEVYSQPWEYTPCCDKYGRGIKGNIIVPGKRISFSHSIRAWEIKEKCQRLSALVGRRNVPARRPRRARRIVTL